MIIISMKINMIISQYKAVSEDSCNVELILCVKRKMAPLNLMFHRLN